MFPLFLQTYRRGAQQMFFAVCLAVSAFASLNLSLASPPPPPPKPTKFYFENRANMNRAVHFLLTFTADGQTVWNRVRVNYHDAPPGVTINLPTDFTVKATLEVIETSTGKLLGTKTATKLLQRDKGSSLDLRTHYTTPGKPEHKAVMFATNTEFRREGVCELEFHHSSFPN